MKKKKGKQRVKWTKQVKGSEIELIITGILLGIGLFLILGSEAGEISLQYKILGLILLIIGVLIGFWSMKKRRKRRKREKRRR